MHALEASMKKYITLVMVSGAVARAQRGAGGGPDDRQSRVPAKTRRANPSPTAWSKSPNVDNGRKITAKTNKNGEYFHHRTYARNVQRDLCAMAEVDASWQDSAWRWRCAGRELRPQERHRRQGQAPSEEAAEEAAGSSKQNEKIKGLNAKLAEARDLEKAGNYDQAVTLLQEATTAEPTKDLLWAYLGRRLRAAPRSIPRPWKPIRRRGDQA